MIKLQDCIDGVAEWERPACETLPTMLGRLFIRCDYSLLLFQQRTFVDVEQRAQLQVFLEIGYASPNLAPPRALNVRWLLDVVYMFANSSRKKSTFFRPWCVSKGTNYTRKVNKGYNQILAKSQRIKHSPHSGSGSCFAISHANLT